ncbi:MAG: Fe-S cluster assembly protein SufD [Rhodospirillaceae bacterium]|nr:Fe-S cluster assembly protein SufD [Rhodospirillaceae bacterium]|tara:strand:- start:4462 stop:5790 length:1329 start_codon:yes stop_codon:yes gene_type:complete
MNSNSAANIPFHALTDQVSANNMKNWGDWLRGVNARGQKEYEKIGWPNGKMESWKYTNLNLLAKAPLELASPLEFIEIPEERVLSIDAAKIVLVNGRLDRKLSNFSMVGDGVSVNNFGDIREHQKVLFEDTEEASYPIEGLPIAALNSAMISDAVFIEVKDGCQVEKPLHIISVGSGNQICFAPRLFILAGRHSAVDIIESHVGCMDSTYFTNCVTKVRVAEGARCGHYKLQNEPEKSSHIALTNVCIRARGSYDSFVASLGGLLSRNETRALIEGRDAECHINGTYLGAGTQHIDNTTFIEHASECGRSRQVYKGVLAQHARGVFQGKIYVHPNAQKTDGFQMNRAMLLSDTAEIDSKPELEIYADDVKCSHGATVGELEEEHLFYLRARGIDSDRARRLLVEAYVQEVLDEARSGVFAEAIKEITSKWLIENLFENFYER